ncbi:stalk domain-containing protein [Acetivibrio cellulolyticus]|uniref:stalk domain-containing protein n=1 Tax=Acetivibrio cellulolyticus TaxID=35830 RepID=UPI0001E2EB8E|nr:copper amine oxidase N-terminal domain-containing protein [Acetivibrio cellulolyticus]
MIFRKYSKVVCFCLATFAIFCTTSYASSVLKTIQVSYDNIKIYVNDKLISPKDGNGKSVEPFICDGTTYLPVRAVSEALGKEVKWDGKTKSIYIGEPQVTDESMVWLNDVDYFNSYTNDSCSWEVCDEDSFKDSTGNFCSRASDTRIIGTGSIYTDYLINKKYSKIKGKFILSYDTRSSQTNGYLKLYGDNKLLYTSAVMKGGVLPIDFDVDITSVEKLRVELNNEAGQTFDIVHYGLVDVGLYK